MEETPPPIKPKFSTASKVSFIAVAILSVGLSSALFLVQQRQDTRSKASVVNLATNPGCETSTVQLKGYNSTLTRSTSNPHSGVASCKLVYTSGSSYDIEIRDTIINPAQGATYTGSAYVRSDVNAGTPIFVSFREAGGSTGTQTTNGPAVNLTSSWQLVKFTYTVKAAGRTELLMHIGQNNSTSGQYFYVDDIYFQLGITAVLPTATKAPTAVPPTATKVPTGIPPTATKAPTGVPPTATKVPTAVPPTATKTPVPTAIAATATPFPTSVVTPTKAVPTNTPAPTSTPVPGTTYAGVSVLLHGIGKGGDSVNPGGQGNLKPLHIQRTVTVEIFDAQNQLVLSKQGMVTFDAAAGNLKGNVELGTQLSTGIYSVKVKTDQYLRGLVSGIQTITKGQVNPLPSVTLVAGDINNDNQVNIVDYNIIVGCYSDLLPPISCAGSSKSAADLTDDGYVNQFDYNLFIRELTNIGGQ